mmetsp:Transcript_54898/g.100652  ORF Transcript_54898/g.100652 Transcript_54898/m.100652 type:complete len:242 (+) Transcript_54898:512-1237(+)
MKIVLTSMVMIWKERQQILPMHAKCNVKQTPNASFSHSKRIMANAGKRTLMLNLAEVFTTPPSRDQSIARREEHLNAQTIQQPRLQITKANVSYLQHFSSVRILPKVSLVARCLSRLAHGAISFRDIASKAWWVNTCMCGGTMTPVMETLLSIQTAIRLMGLARAAKIQRVAFAAEVTFYHTQQQQHQHHLMALFTIIQNRRFAHTHHLRLQSLIDLKTLLKRCATFTGIHTSIHSITLKG